MKSGTDSLAEEEVRVETGRQVFAAGVERQRRWRLDDVTTLVDHVFGLSALRAPGAMVGTTSLRDGVHRMGARQ